MKRDHPREYGENLPPDMTRAFDEGSSPRIRGESLCIDPKIITPRIIPANTGRIVVCIDPGEKAGDHPREYGENWREERKSTMTVGSSPRIRGE